jgi:hypothetical protein
VGNMSLEQQLDSLGAPMAGFSVRCIADGEDITVNLASFGDPDRATVDNGALV